MKPFLIFVFIFLFIGLHSPLLAQDTLPKFTLRNVGGNRIIIGWVNTFPSIRQISIQRSFDSLKNYKTILTVTDPAAVYNGYADSKAPNDSMFYRLFYAMQGGAFYFSEAKRPALDTTRAGQRIRDNNNNNMITEPVLNGFVPSFYVYTNKNGYVQLNLPNADKKKYTIKFFEEDGMFLFEIKNVKQRTLTLDKSNFLHAGWFGFELYDEEKVIEKHKFYIEKDF